MLKAGFQSFEVQEDLAHSLFGDTVAIKRLLHFYIYFLLILTAQSINSIPIHHHAHLSTSMSYPSCPRRYSPLLAAPPFLSLTSTYPLSHSTKPISLNPIPSYPFPNSTSQPISFIVSPSLPLVLVMHEFIPIYLYEPFLYTTTPLIPCSLSSISCMRPIPIKSITFITHF